MNSTVLLESGSQGEPVENLCVKSSSRHPKGKKLPEQAVNVMKAWMDKHMSHPYATKKDTRELVNLTGLTVYQVQGWLGNARYKLKKLRSATKEYAGGTSANPPP